MRRESLTNWTLFGVSLLLSVLAADGVFRLHERHSLSAASQLEGERIHLDKLNYNDTTVTRARPQNEFRVLSFGDSFCYSIMNPSLSYNGLIAENLQENLQDRRARVVNLGEPASTMTDYAAAHRFWSEKIEHDAVLFNIYLGNDLLDIAYAYTPVQWQPNRAFKELEYHMSDGTKRSPVPRKFPLRMFDHAYALYLTNFKQTDVVMRAIPAKQFNVAANDNLPEKLFLETNQIQLVNFDFSKIKTIAEGYRAMHAFLRYVSDLRKSGMKTTVTLAPNEIHVDQAFRQRVAEAYDLDLSTYDLTLPARMVARIRDHVDPEIDLLDLSPYFVCRGERQERLYYLTNTHWGPEGNALAGKIIANHLKHSWFGAPEMPLDDSCDVEEYHARFNRISDADIGDIVHSLIQQEGPKASPGLASETGLASENIIPNLNCGALDGAVVDESGGIFLWGWAYDPRTKTPARSVILLHNGKRLSLEPIVRERPGVATLLGDPSLLATGWNFRVPPQDLVGTEHHFEAFALFDDGKLGKLPGEGRGRIVIAATARQD